jgi:hypothetical protein
VLYAAQLTYILPLNNPKVVEYNQYVASGIALNVALASLSSLLAEEVSGHADPARLNSLVSASKYFEERRSESSPVRVTGFFEASAPYFLFVSFLTLFIHVAWSPRGEVRGQASRYIVMSLAAYVIWMGPNWVRNFVFNNQGRAVFSYVHFDISPACFVFQEIQVLVLCGLISSSWIRWSCYSSEVQRVCSTWDLSNCSSIETHSRACYCGALIDQWQVHSIVIAFAFLPWSLFYWRLTFMYNDVRYYSSALATHVLWAITWSTISLASIHAWRSWSDFKSSSLARLSGESVGDTRKLEYLSLASPVSHFRLVVVGVCSVGTFLFPFIIMMF